MNPIARNLTLPDDAVTQTFAFLGRKGSGKTYAAGKLVEALLDAGSQCVVLDPLGNWFGLRLAKSGKSASRFSIPILGGERGDVPLEHKAGKLVAQFVVETGSSCILDVSAFRKSQRKEFVADFAEELFHRKKTQRTPMHLVIEEAQVFAPQRAGAGEERMLGAIEDIVRLGRNVGIGCSMISQRPQSVNKEVLNQAEPLVVFQLVAKQERDAIARWCEHVGEDANAAMKELPSLHTGDCYFWSPAWLRTFVKTRFLPKETFDASATPELGGKQSAPVKLKPVDLDALKTAIDDTIKRAEADDPKALRAKITELQREVDRLRGQSPVVDPASIDRAVAAAIGERDRHWKAEILKIEDARSTATFRLDKIVRPAREILELAQVNGELDAPAIAPPPAPRISQGLSNSGNSIKRPATPVSSGPGRSTLDAPPSELRPAHRRILDALAWFAVMGIGEPSRSNVAAIAGVSPKSSSFANDVSRLSSLGLVRYPSSGLLQLTDAGRDVANHPEAPPSLSELHDAWRHCPALRPAHRRLLDALLEAHPSAMSREDLAAAVGVSPNSSSFANDVSRLSSLGLAEYPAAGQVRAGGLLFPLSAPI